MIRWIGIAQDILEHPMEVLNLELVANQLKLYGIHIVPLAQVPSQPHLLPEIEEQGYLPQEGLLLVHHIAWKNHMYVHKQQMPVIWFQDGAPGWIHYILEHLDGLDIHYVNLVYCRFHKIPLKIMSSERWTLAEFTPDDISRIHSLKETGHLYIDEKEFRCANLTQLDRIDEAYIENMYGFYGYGMWIARSNEKNSSIIGVAGFDHIDETLLPASCTLRRLLEQFYCLQAGYLVTPPYRRQGYGLEFLQGITDYAREYIGAEKIILLIDSDNLPSVNLAKKAGFNFLEEIICEHEKDSKKTISIFYS